MTRDCGTRVHNGVSLLSKRYTLDEMASSPTAPRNDKQKRRHCERSEAISINRGNELHV